MKSYSKNRRRKELYSNENKNKSDYYQQKKMLYGSRKNSSQKEDFHCQDKRSYSDENSAIAMATHREEETGIALYYYKCAECLRIHLTRFSTKNTTRATFN